MEPPSIERNTFHHQWPEQESQILLSDVIAAAQVTHQITAEE